MDSWDIVKKFYNQTFGIPEKVVDLMALEPYVALLAHGYSNKKISLMLDESEEMIKDMFLDLLKFEGFKQDLDFDPVKIYMRHRFNRYAYVQEVKGISPATSSDIAIISYQVNDILREIEEKIQKYVK